MVVVCFPRDVSRAKMDFCEVSSLDSDPMESSFVVLVVVAAAVVDQPTTKEDPSEYQSGYCCLQLGRQRWIPVAVLGKRKTKDT